MGVKPIKAVPADVPLFRGDCGDAAFVAEIMDRYQVEAIIHFAASVVVPDSVLSPLAYYENNTMKARALIECAVRHRIPHFCLFFDCGGLWRTSIGSDC